MPFSQPGFIKDQNKIDQRFDALFQNASLGMLVANAQGEIVLANNFLINAFGYDNADELVGRKVELLIPSRFHHRHVNDRESFNNNPERRPMGAGRDLFGVKKSGQEFPVEVSLSNYTNEEGFFVIGFVSDITRRKEIEQSENFFAGVRYNTVKAQLAGIVNDVTVNRTAVAGGFFLTKNILMKGEYVIQKYKDFVATDYRNGGKFNGYVIEAVVGF